MDNIWTRRSNSKLSLSTSTTNSSAQPDSNRIASFPKRFGTGEMSATSAKASPFGTPTVTSPTASATNAFGLGSGAFASFGGNKAAKTPGSGPGSGDAGSGKALATGGSDAGSSGRVQESETTAPAAGDRQATTTEIVHPLSNKWVFWFRPPTSKNQGFVDYEKTLHAMAYCSTIEEFWTVYSHLRRVSTLPQVSEYHFFKWGIRPVWEDEVNKKGGKWVVRLKKGVADRYWEDLLIALIGEQFGEAGDDVCGAVVSVRTGEDIISIWTRSEDGRVLKIRETMKHILNFPGNTRVEFKSHDSSIQQRTAIEEHRREKQQNQSSGQTHHHGAIGSLSNHTGGSSGSGGLALGGRLGSAGAIGSGRVHHQH